MVFIAKSNGLRAGWNEKKQKKLLTTLQIQQGLTFWISLQVTVQKTLSKVKNFLDKLEYVSRLVRKCVGDFYPSASDLTIYNGPSQNKSIDINFFSFLVTTYIYLFHFYFKFYYKKKLFWSTLYILELKNLHIYIY